MEQPRKLDATNTIRTLRRLLGEMGNTVQYMQAMDAMTTKIAALNFTVNEQGFKLAQALIDIAALKGVDPTVKLTAMQSLIDAQAARIALAEGKINTLTSKLDSIKNYEGVTNAQGTYSVTFSPALAAIPFIQVELINANPRDVAIITRSAGSFSVTVQRRVDVLGLLPTYTSVANAAVIVQIWPK